MVYIKEFNTDRVVLSDGKILTCDTSRGQSFDYNVLKDILEI